jgi:hypothetical protein
MSWCGARGRSDEAVRMGDRAKRRVGRWPARVRRFLPSAQADTALRRVAVSPIRRFVIIACARGLLFYLPDSLHYYGHE